MSSENETKSMKSMRQSIFASSVAMWSFTLFVVSICGVLLLINSVAAYSVYGVIPRHQDEKIANGIGQLFFFVIPILLLMLEWHLFDRIYRLVRR